MSASRARVSIHSKNSEPIDVDEWEERKRKRIEKQNKLNRQNVIEVPDSDDDQVPVPLPPKKQRRTDQDISSHAGPSLQLHDLSKESKLPPCTAGNQALNKLVTSGSATQLVHQASTASKRKIRTTALHEVDPMFDNMPYVDLPTSEKPEIKRFKGYDSDSSEDVDWDLNHRWSTPHKKAQKFQAGDNPEIVKSKPEYFSEEVIETAKQFKALLLQTTGPSIGVDHLLRSSGYTYLHSTSRRGSINLLRRNDQAAAGSRSRIDLARDVELDDLRPAVSFMRSAGPISQIVQLGSYEFIITSNAVDGFVNNDPSVPETERERPDPFNKSGSLLYYINGRPRVVDGHYRLDNSRSSWETRPGKTYTVSAATTIPTYSDRLVTGGGDGNIVQWVISKDGNYDVDTKGDEEDKSPLCENKRTKLKGIIFDLQFQPVRNRALAASCGDGHVYIFRNFCENNDHIKLPISPTHDSGSMVWGFGATDNLIFTISEPDTEEGLFRGFHRAFDLRNGPRPAYELDVTDAGDTLCLNPRGDQLAISTLAEDSTHSVRLYDVRNKVGRMIHKIPLEPFDLPSGRPGDVNRIAFDPYDGTLLAIARSDNCVALYDSRFLRDGPLSIYRHGASGRPYVPQVGQPDGYGVFDFRWVSNTHTHRMGLVSGGEDGCVRLWDVGVDPRDSETVIARMEDSIAMMSIGNLTNQEYRLIAGDAGGRITAFDSIHT